MANVIKIKFGDTLRRISTDELASDMVKFRKKICSVFSLKDDADFTLTYIDEDGDVVTLCDDDDLDDLDSQDLDPIRMTVTLNPDNNAKSSVSVTPSENSTPVNSTQDQSLNSAVSVILKFVPERQHIALLNLLLEATWENMTGSSDMKEQKGFKIDEPSETSKKEDLQVETVKKYGVIGDIDLNAVYSHTEALINELDAYIGHDNAQLKKSVDFGTCVDRNECPFIGMPLDNHSNDIGLIGIHQGIICDGCEQHPITGPRFKSKLKDNFDLCLLCLERSGLDAAGFIRMDLPPTCSSNGSPVCNDQKDPEVVITPKTDQKSEVRGKKSNGTVDPGDMYFDAQPHEDR